jgi:hypothetical protein
LKRLALVTIAVWLTAAVPVAGAAHLEGPGWQLSIEKTCPGLYQGIAYYRGATWRFERRMNLPITRASYAEHAVGSCEAVVPFLQRWRNLVNKRAQEYRQYLKAQRSTGIPAGQPPHYSAWLCIHHYEGSWTDPNAPYYGGLQMDYGFMNTYGHQLLISKGTADHWTPLEQMWVAEKAYAAGRGFHPWSNTARYCGLL